MKRIFILLTVFCLLGALVPSTNAYASFYETNGVYEHFELPVNGASGFAAVDINLRQYDDGSGSILQVVKAGEAFTILEDNGYAYLKVQTPEGKVGYAFSDYVMVNLPDVIPSIVYECVNSEYAVYHSAGKNLPQITGRQLYNVKATNLRFNGKEQYAMPLLYKAAMKVQIAQRLAMKYGESLKICETYRPKETQMSVANSLNVLMQSDADVYKAINTSPWHKGWFISQGVSNHQRGIAMDVTLVKVNKTVTKYCGIFPYTEVVDYTEREMPTSMHELSAAAATFTTPVSSKTTDWKTATYANTMTPAAVRLQKYCTAAGLTPLASEWWHFEDQTACKKGTGEFYILGGNLVYKNGRFTEVHNTTSKQPK